MRISTQVNADAQIVWDNFNQDLFEKLNPPFPPARLLRYDGNQPGDEVHIELNFIIFKQLWISKITAQEITDKEFYFIDEGSKLPFFLTAWKHKHRICRHKNATLIIDEISYKTPNRILDWLLYPALWLQFVYRKPIYKRIFKDC
ncbi:MAG: hypothetical protein JJT94_13785 [Bernardetiaceae bacterium]|nr:hypothetical protein [Bernardetiaceae bacterium]